MFRFPTRWADDDLRKVRAALLMLLSLRGTPVLYQGDEIGLANTPVAHEDMRDPLGVRYFPYYEGRDAGAHADAVERRPRRRVHRSGCAAVAALRRCGRVQCGGPARGSRFRCSRWPVT